MEMAQYMEVKVGYVGEGVGRVHTEKNGQGKVK